MSENTAFSRKVVVAPGMCSGGSLIFGRIGDWTWESVAEACHTNVHAARTAEGQPTYLSFYYYRVRGGKAVHPHGLAFGDELEVTSRVFQFGSSSVLTLHRLAPAGSGLGTAFLDPTEVYETPNPECMYAETLNRWIARGRPDSNRVLTETVPHDFDYADLPRLPNQFSPRTLVGRARHTGSFCTSGPPGFTVTGEAQSFEYALDAVRDINGAGLVYFASYFSIFDTALLRLWRGLGRSERQFLQRRVIDQKVGFFGNADLGSLFTITARRWQNVADPLSEIADLELRDSTTGRLLAVAAIETETPSTPA
ncbi:LnmK family bifunctional acyltransferase/decarboxylase [Micromonospora sp. NPDC051925]|uniref:LnmK family bifunctional acyltransferase/decarboxylase n=1 Tax=Micromonospora sp. NPDC051925 TaxID=3364288 RepID=UPI0037C5C8FA